MTEPLTNPPFPVEPPSRLERVLRFIPIPGWFILPHLEVRRRMPKVEYINRQIAARTEPTLAAWGDDPERQAVAVAVSEAIRDEFGRPNSHFLPEDRLDLLLWDRGGGMGGEILFCIIEVERRIGKKIRCRKDFWTLTLGQFVDRIVIQIPAR